MACDLLSWTQQLTLVDPLATAEPKRRRYCLLHGAPPLATAGRRTYLRVKAHWPWTKERTAAFTRFENLQQRT